MTTFTCSTAGANRVSHTFIVIIIVLTVTIVIVDEVVFVLVEAKSLSQQLDPTVLADLYTYHKKSASAQKSLSLYVEETVS